MEWNYAKKIINPNSIERFEKLVGYTFPEDFKQTVYINNGGRPVCEVFDMEDEKEKVFNALLSFNEDDGYSIWNMLRLEGDAVVGWVHEQLDWRYIPFANDPFGNKLCFDRTNNHIVFFDHEEEDGGMYFVASSFTELINSLYDVEYDDDEF